MALQLVCLVAQQKVTWTVVADAVQGPASKRIFWLAFCKHVGRRLQGDLTLKFLFDRGCIGCGRQIPSVQKILAIYDFSIDCKHCGLRMEISTTVLIINMLLAQFFAVLVTHFYSAERNFGYFLIMEIWAFFIFLPIITLICFGVERH